MKFFSLQNIDLTGFIVSFLCAIHCAVFPILISLGLLSSTVMDNHMLFEWFIIGLSAVIASWSVIRSYFTKHKNIIPTLMVVLGFVLLIIDHGFHIHSWLLVVGGLLIASAHILNWRILHR